MSEEVTETREEGAVETESENQESPQSPISEEILEVPEPYVEDQTEERALWSRNW